MATTCSNPERKARGDEVSGAPRTGSVCSNARELLVDSEGIDGKSEQSVVLVGKQWRPRGARFEQRNGGRVAVDGADSMTRLDT